MCMLCGDPFSVENVLGPLLSHQSCYLSGDRSLTLETMLGDTKRKVEVILSSYHSAMDFRDELIHGFILVYSVKRRASLATLTTFSLNIPELPIQLLAVSDEDFVNSDLTSMLITEGNTLADRLNAHFMTSTTTIPQKSIGTIDNENMRNIIWHLFCSFILHPILQRSLREEIRDRRRIFHGGRSQTRRLWRRYLRKTYARPALWSSGTTQTSTPDGLVSNHGTRIRNWVTIRVRIRNL